MRAPIRLGLALALCTGAAAPRAEDCVSSALEAIEGGREQAAVGAVEAGAREGDERCMFILGMWLLTGEHGARDLAAGSRWLSEAAQQGLPIAQSNLGLLYASGWGVEKDEKAAADWYRAAAEHGDPLGQAALGATRYLGAGIPKDPVEAYKWTALAAAQGNERARAYLPVMEKTLTPNELEQAKRQVADFRPLERPTQPRFTRRDAMRAFGLQNQPSEYERFFGY